MGINDMNAVLYLLDFGLAKKYRSSKTLVQYPYIKKKKLTGTARYASIHALEEMEQSRRDDLESTGYVLMYFLRGNLPWQGLKIKTKDNRYQKILDKKKATSSEDLCKNFPIEFKQYIDYTKNLGYTENPDYDKLRKKFINVVLHTVKEKFDFVYDWTTQNDIKRRKKNNLILEADEKYFKKENEKEKVELSFDNLKSNNIEENKNIEEDKNKNDKNKKKGKADDDNKNEKVESRCCIM
jgi:serine/threonine protein kinase